MFRQLVTPDPTNPKQTVPTNSIDNINSLFVYHPLQISALVETVWLNRVNASLESSPFIPWSPQISNFILRAPFFPGYAFTGPSPTTLPPPPQFTLPPNQPGIQGTWNGSGSPPSTIQYTNWDHLIYAYLVESTGIFEIFSKVLETYMFSEQLETPSPASQLFWRNVEFLIFGDAMPSMVWTTSGRLRRDEIANRMTAYYWMFGLDLPQAADLAGQHPYQKPAAANRDFITTFEAFGREVWRGIVNTKNLVGANETDPTVIATLARRLYDMMATPRQHGNQLLNEFRAVSILSFLHLAILYDSPPIVDLKATASSPEMRLKKMAERVGMRPNPKTKPFLDLSSPFSILMQSIETGAFNDAAGAQTLFLPVSDISRNAEVVIDQYSLATGRDLKSQAVSVVPRSTSSAVPASRRQAPPPQLAAPLLDGRTTPRQ